MLLMMNRPVLNLLDYRQRFDPWDALWDAQALASFAQTHLRTNAEMKYHAAMLCRAAQGPAFVDGGPLFYWSAENKPSGFDTIPGCADGDLVDMKRLYDAFDASDPDALRVIAFLFAAHRMAGKPLPEVVDAAQSLRCWRREAHGVASAETAIETMPPVLRLEPRADAYVLDPMNEPMTSKMRIRTIRIEAMSVSREGRHAKVRVRAGDESTEIERGGCVYANCIGNRVVKLLPDSVQSGDRRLFRAPGQSAVLSCQDARGAREFPLENVSSFALTDGQERFVYIQEGRLHLEQSKFITDYRLRDILNSDVVEVEMRGQDCLVLMSNGRVRSNAVQWEIPGFYARLSDVKKEGAHR